MIGGANLSDKVGQVGGHDDQADLVGGAYEGSILVPRDPVPRPASQSARHRLKPLQNEGAGERHQDACAPGPP